MIRYLHGTLKIDLSLIIQSNEYNRLNKSNMKINDILKLLWFKYKIQGVFVSNMMLVNNTSSINRIIRTYNPFAKINDFFVNYTHYTKERMNYIEII